MILNFSDRTVKGKPGETGPVIQASEPGCGQVMDGSGAVMGASVCRLLNRKGKGSGARWRSSLVMSTFLLTTICTVLLIVLNVCGNVITI